MTAKIVTQIRPFAIFAWKDMLIVWKKRDVQWITLVRSNTASCAKIEKLATDVSKAIGLTKGRTLASMVNVRTMVAECAILRALPSVMSASMGSS